MANLNLTDPVRVGLGVPGAGHITTLRLDPTGWVATTSHGLTIAEQERPQGLTTYTAEEGRDRAWCRSWPQLKTEEVLPPWFVRDALGRVWRLRARGAGCEGREYRLVPLDEPEEA